MNNFDAVIDFGSSALKLCVFDQEKKNIYSSEQKIIFNSEKLNLEHLLNILIRDAEKNLSTHIDNVVVMYDNPKFFSLDFSIKKEFDHAETIKKVYDSLIEEALFFVSQNNFKDQIIHIAINDIVVNKNVKIKKIIEDIKIKSLILEIKFICLNKTLLEEVSNIFKKNNLKIVNVYCSSYVKTISYKKKFITNNNIIFLDIGHERSSSIFFKDDKFESFKSFPVGGNNITKDISKVLNLDLNYSETLKIKLNKLEDDMSPRSSENNKINLYKEMLEKNISIDLLKQIIEARINEIIELAVFSNKYIENLNYLNKPKLVFIGGGSRIFTNDYNINANESVSELKIFEENNANVCKAGLDYHNSHQSFFIKNKKKLKKTGFFESFFNMFSR